MAVKGHGTIIEFGDAENYTDSTSWTKFAKVTEVTPPQITGEDIDVSHMESEEQFDEFDPGWANGGEPEATIQFDADEAETVYGLFRQKKGFRMTFRNNSRWNYNGYIKEFSNEVERKGIVTVKVKFKVSGKPQFVKNAA